VLQIIKKFYYIIFFTNKIFQKPVKKKILIFDSEESDILKRNLKKKEIEIVDTRFALKKNQNLNIYVYFKNLLNLKFSTKNYYEEYINITDPTHLITWTDNSQLFYKLKVKSNVTKISIQKAFRSLDVGDILFNLKNLKKKKKELSCDYLLMFNKEIGKKFQEFLDSKVIPIGSFKSNFYKKKNKKKTINYLYISVFRPNEEIKIDDLFFLENLKKYCLNKKIKIQILGSSDNFAKEKNFYIKIFGDRLEKFLPRHLERDTYGIVDKSEIIISTISTLGYEAASRGNKVGLFSINKNLAKNSFRFGWPVKKKPKGFFWTNINNYQEINRIIGNLLNLKKNKITSIIKKEFKNIMEYDEDNSKFLRLIKKRDKYN
tara:strand:+ start:8939 stop:10060 length:1122 start_codon:yes stop_codon:yes gene_type:complete